MKRLARVVAAIAAILVLATLAAGVLLVRSVPPLSGRETLPGLDAEVEVVWDSLAVPHIIAASDRDAFRVLGYLHARDRLWQMETLRRTAEGRMAELLGSRAVSSDRFLRSLDITRAAERAVAVVPEATRGLLDAYVAGINQWVRHPTRPLPVEFHVLWARPEAWTARQVVAIERLMAWDLVTADVELNLARAMARVGPERVRELFPVYPADGAVIIQRGQGSWRRGAARTAARRTIGMGAEGPLSVGWVPSAHLVEAAVPEIPPLAREALEAAAMTRASNSWVIGPARSRSGRPILANDPHLTFRAPALWYLAAITSPGFDVAGATIPGLPGIILGHNRRIAWGLTNIGVDDVDYVIERLSLDSNRVLTTGGWEAVEVVRDTIRVRGGALVPFTLRRTGHGPLVPASGLGRGHGEEWVEAVAMRWNAHHPSDELTAILAVNRARSWDEFLAAVAQFRSPEQNWIYADVDGNIGYTASGAVPVRRSGIGLLPTPGWTDEGRWERYLDFDELPRVVNPPEGFIVTANNRVIGDEYPWHLTAQWAQPYRAERIRELILGGGPHTPDDVQRMQMDTLDAFARWARALAARAARDAGRADAAEALERWDGTMGADRTEAALFYVWYRGLQRLTYEDELGGGGYAPSSPLQAWLRAGASPWFDDARTAQREDLPDLSARAMREALERADGVTWGQVHPTVFPHLLGGIGPLNAVLRLTQGPFPRAGSLYTVNVADFGSLSPPFRNTHGASFRQVVDLADIEGAQMIVTTGQSGNPVSRHYRDQRRMWWRGALQTVPLSRDRVAASGRLVLVP